MNRGQNESITIVFKINLELKLTVAQRLLRYAISGHRIFYTLIRLPFRIFHKVIKSCSLL